MEIFYQLIKLELYNMKDLFLLSLLLVASSTFKIDQSSIKHKSYNMTLTGSCSDQRLNLVNQSINACQKYVWVVSNYAKCITGYMQDHTEQQKWDTIVQANSDIKSSYWFYNDCSIKYNITSSYKITVWKAEQTQDLQKQSNKENKKNDKQLENFQSVQNCTSERLSAAKYAINYCQNNDSSLQVICIKNNMMTKLGQKWNAVAFRNYNSFGIEYFAYNGCDLKLRYGDHNRTYIVWKAQQEQQQNFIIQ